MAGTSVEMLSRLTESLLLALAILAIRSRVKRGHHSPMERFVE